MSQNDFWESLARGHVATTYQSSFDLHLTGKAQEETFSSVRNLTDSGRRAGALQLPVPSGTMVVFAGDLGAMLALSNPPAKGMPGEVVSVKSAGGDVTSHDGVVFVKWADGQFRPVHAEYLRLAKIPKTSSTKEADLEDACWEGYEAFGMKEKDGKQVPNCVPVKSAKTNPFLAQVSEPGSPEINGLWYVKVVGPEGDYYWLDHQGTPPALVPATYTIFKQGTPKSVRLYKTEKEAEQALPQAKDYVLRYMSGDPEPTGKFANRIRVSSLGDLSQFLKTADGKLVHKSTKDLWSFKKDADGGLVVERMFDDTGKPLKA